MKGISPYNFCTLFDRNYLYKGLALHGSLMQHCREFTLWILCMDQTTYELLGRMDLPKVNLISLAEFENSELKKAKADRTAGEYAWTCASNFCRFMLEKYSLLSITYLDSDLYFFNDPQEIFDEIQDASIAIIEHRYSEGYKHLEPLSGRFNVGWVTFRNNQAGREAAWWWSDRVLEWCYNRYEDGKIGDQMYLNDWPDRFKDLRIIRHKGADVAPWNVENYRLSQVGKSVYVDEQKLIFYHFHSFHLLSPRRPLNSIIGYRLRRPVIDLIYKPYFRALRGIISAVRKTDKNFNYGYRPFNLKEFILSNIKTRGLI